MPRQTQTVESELSPLEREKARKIELLQQVRVMREGLKLSQGKVTNGDPAFEYCWVNTRDERQHYFQAMGWQLVTNDNGPAVETKWKKTDGTHVRGDVILYQIPKDFFEAMQLLNVLEGQDRAGGIEDAFMAQLQREGVPAYKPRT